MSSNAHFDSSFEAFRDRAKPKQGLRLTDKICDVSHFLLRMRVQLQFGKLSRAPLQLLRMEVLPGTVECECLARTGDPWDTDLPDRIARRHFTLQVLHDAIDMRALLYHAIPDAEAAQFRIYRQAAEGVRELIIVGHTHRIDQSARGVHSLTLRAKVLGFRFRLEDDCLKAIAENDHVSLHPNARLF